MDGVNAGANGSGPRISNRRRESQKPGDIQSRPYAIRGSKVAHGPGSSLDRRSAKRLPEPYGMFGGPSTVGRGGGLYKTY